MSHPTTRLMNSPILHLVFAPLVCFIALLLPACSITRPPITAVTVRDSKFELVKVLTPAEIAEFDRHWRAKKKLSASAPSNTRSFYGDYKLDISRGGRGDRWLYHATGKLTLLTVMAGMADYQIEDVRSFNKLIGASR
jgi:hypothetical protein